MEHRKLALQPPLLECKVLSVMTSSNGKIFHVAGPLCGEFLPVTGELLSQRPVIWSFDVFFDLRLNKWLSKQSWGWWFEMSSCSLWRHRNASAIYSLIQLLNSLTRWLPFLPEGQLWYVMSLYHNTSNAMHLTHVNWGLLLILWFSKTHRTYFQSYLY